MLRLFSLDLTASDTARLTGLRVRAVNALYLRLRRCLQTRCPVPASLDGAVGLDERYFGPRRMRGKRGRSAGSKTIVFGLFKRGGQVDTEIVPDCSKKTLQAIIRGKINGAAMVNIMAGAATTSWWTPALTATFASATARTNLCKAPRTSTASSPAGASPKRVSSSSRAGPNTRFYCT